MTPTKSLFLAILALLILVPLPVAAQAPSLGTAGDFAVLGGSAVTNTGSTIVTGELGVSPGTAVTGFPPGVVNPPATIHINDGPAQQAQSDLTVAYDALAGLACGTDLSGQDLGSVGPLGPGVYCFSTSAQLTGTLTLDAGADPDAEFIFQIGSTLTTATNAIVELIDGANSCNVYFQVGSSATLGTGTSLAGNILALTSITLTTGANASGSLLARNGAVTLDTNSVAVCDACTVITLAPTSLPNGVLNTLYGPEVISATGGTAAYTFTVISGSLPAGLTLAPDGTLSGTPTASGSFTFTVRATDAEGCVGSRQYTLVINPIAGCPVITLTPATLPPAQPGVLYDSGTITAAGGASPYTFAVTSGALPAGLAIVPGPGPGFDTFQITGTPTESGSFSFTITATDSNGCLGSQIYSLLVGCPVINLSPATLQPAFRGLSYSQTITASGGTEPYTFAVTSGSLPPGLTLSPDGALTGTPTTEGNFTFTVTATDDSGCEGARTYDVAVLSRVQIPVLDWAGLALLGLLLGVAGVFVAGRLT